MFLASALAASPAALFVSADERKSIAAQARLHEHPKRFAARSAALLCLTAMQREGVYRTGAAQALKDLWNDGTARALDFPLYDADFPNDACVEKPRRYFRMHGKRV